MEKRILEEQVTYESGLRVHRQVIERRTSKAEDMLEVAQLHNTLGRLEGQIEALKSKAQLDPEYEASYTQQIRRTSKAEDMLEVAQLHNTLGRLEGQIEALKSKAQLDPEYEASYTQQIKKLLSDQEVIRQAIEIHNQYIAGFDRE